YDTSDDKNVQNSYQQAVQEGADLVVGPLTKSGVEQINSLKSLPVPVISLNYSQASNHHISDLYEFGLAPEDEARQAARAALQTGQQRALVLVQADEWGGRVSRAFIDEWYRLGGQTPIKVVFSPSDNINNVVRQALKIQLSSAQKERLTTQPKRRQDIDMIFLAAQANVARQIKPLLDFYYANDLPVYGTSSIYALPPNPSLDRDLNGVYVCDMPWLLSPQSAEPRLHATIDELWPGTAETYARFFALGIDAFNLSIHLSQLKGQPLPGVTGQLYLTNDGRVERQVQCAKFSNGTPR
ncbi:MAG: penicillin-binding protein activator, partial [Gammaproteobacteria bacterium]